MKKKWRLFCLALPMCAAVMLSACGAKSPYSLKSGRYEFYSVEFTNAYNKESGKFSASEYLNSEEEFRRSWNFLLSLSVNVDENTEYIHTKDGRWVILKDSFAYEPIGNSSLRAHISRLNLADGNAYEVTVYFNPVPVYY